jgi:porin
MNKFSLTFLSLALLMGTTSAFSQDIFDPNGQYMLGDWNGKRTELAQDGVKFEANILADAAYLAHGGRHPHADPTVTSQLWLGTALDMGKLVGWNDVKIRMVMTARQGQSTSIRNIQDPHAPELANVQGTYGRGNQDSRLTELSIEKDFKAQGINIKVGRLGMGTDFDVMACDFVSTAFCTAQMGKWQGNIWMNTPVAQWGGRLKYQINPEIFTQIGVYEFNPDNGNGAAEGQGWSLDTQHADGVSIPVEVVWQPHEFINNLSGSYRIGGMYNNADNPINQKDVVTQEGKKRTFAAWLAMEQQLLSIGEGKRGLHGFANFTWHDRITNKVDNSQQIGLKYFGLFEQHPHDILAFGVNRIHVNNRIQNPNLDATAEYNLELNYSFNATPWLLVRPNIQYVINPGSSNLVENALVLGLSSRIIF